ncbi:MAG: zinc-binding dehydrogenase [Oscillospiraceae bacterium]|jgi:(R,R)-butanediol dehydrogenase/meso-butanediol dehydrogenase/diacetyl reductase|nr:zinc-binding dehydrogenase [Oscillospiraceae bacterium]
MAGTMKGVVYLGNNVVAVKPDVDIPEPGPNQVLIKVAYAALCATDIHACEGIIGMPAKGPDSPIGHECSGVVVKLGSEAAGKGFEIGDHVVGDPGMYCHYCDACKEGKKCKTKHNRGHGVMAEFKVYNIDSCHKIPVEMPLKRAALIEPTTCVLRALDLVQLKLGQTACLSGAGGIGMLLLRAIKRAGAARITVIEPVEEKWPIIRELGAEFVINPMKQNVKEECDKITGGAGFDYVFEAAGVAAAAPVCLDIAGYGGNVCYFAVYPESYEMPVNLNKLYKKEGRIQTVFVHPTNFPRAVRFVQEDDPVIDKIIGLEVPLDRAPEAFEAFHTSKYSKIVLKCNENL